MEKARYSNGGEAVQVGGTDTSTAVTLAVNTASAALVKGVYWLTPVSADCWVRIDDGTVTPVAEAAANDLFPYGGKYPIHVTVAGLKVISSGKLTLSKAL